MLVVRRQRSIVTLTLCTMLFALCLPVEAQQANKVSRIGYLAPCDAASEVGIAWGADVAAAGKKTTTTTPADRVIR